MLVYTKEILLCQGIIVVDVFLPDLDTKFIEKFFDQYSISLTHLDSDKNGYFEFYRKFIVTCNQVMVSSLEIWVLIESNCNYFDRKIWLAILSSSWENDKN